MYATSKHSPVSVVEVSDNSKTGKVSATYASQKTCPSSCPLQGQGCYAETDFTGFTTRRLNANADFYTRLQLARMEADGIEHLSGSLPLRLHVVGDATSNACADILAIAADTYKAKQGQPVWSYTHAWRDVSRDSWGNVSILASCETTSAVKQAMGKGYAAAIVVNEHPTDRAYTLDDIRILPCPQQIGKSPNCASCKLCFDADRLHKTQTVIGFTVHGAGKKKASAALNILQ